MNNITTHKVHEVLLSIAVSILLFVLLGWIMLNLLTGCGDNYHTADGQLIAGECIGMPWVTNQGGEIISTRGTSNQQGWAIPLTLTKEGNYAIN
jgi:hypothetical protein